MAHAQDKWDRLLITGGGLLAAEVEAPVDWIGRRLGPFELVELLGRGGMGAVYLGRRVDRQFEQQVAVKILSGRLRATSHRDRFRRERQIIADLDHPSIARIIDGGLTDEDRPYLVMEHVPGVSIDEYCAELTPERCLDLILKVCTAVQYAHSRGMIHQDLKPGNILINELGEPKLLDFGIAAAAAGDEPGPGIGLFTPLYAAPEQILGGQTSTATDVYQLGLLIFRLLTGRAAFAGDRDDLAGLKDRILNDPPPRPSVGAPIPHSWGVDLDAIVARCLRKDPAQRYPSVSQLSADLDAMLAHRPVSAAAGGAVYRFRKWARRRRRPVLAGAAIVLLGAATGGAYWRQLDEQRAREQLSADRAAAASELLADILESVDPLAGGQSALGDVISTSSFELSAERKYRPEVQREMVMMTAKTLLDLGRFSDVVKLVEPLVAEPAEPAAPSPARAEYLSLLGYAQYRNGDLRRGLALLQQALAQQLDDPEVDPQALATTLQRTALAERRAARPERARGHLERALELLGTHLPATDIRLAQAHSHLGLVLTDLREYGPAIEAFARADAIYAQAPGDQQLRRAMTLGNLADAERLSGRLEPAEASARTAVTLAEAASEDNPQLLATANVALGNVLISSRSYPEAAERYGVAREIYLESLGPDHPRVALAAHNLGVALRLADRCPEALKYFDEAIRIAEGAYPPDHPELVESRRQRSRCAG